MPCSDHKQLSLGNWLEPDPNSLASRWAAGKGRVLAPTAKHGWVRQVISYELDERVPADIASLYEVGQALMAYGYFYYPFFSAGADQVHRTIESAVGHRCKSLGCPKRRKNMKERLDWLFEKGEITREQREQLEPARHLRNLGSHPSFHSLIPPDWALKVLEIGSAEINRLFCDQGHDE